MNLRSKKGFALPEMLLAALIASFALCGILLTYITCMDSIRISKNVSIATSAAQGIIEEIRNTPFPNIPVMVFQVGGTNYLPIAVSGTLTRWSFPLPVNMPANMCTVYVDETDPEFLMVTVSVCWRQGNKIIGEDLNLNGALNAGEDINANNRIDSTVELVTKVANR